MIVVGVLNTIAAVIFAAALCWRLEQIRRDGGGLQAVAMTVAIAALTLAFVVSGDDVTAAVDDVVFTGAARVLFRGLLAVGVAALIVVFFFPAPGAKRAGRMFAAPGAMRAGRMFAAPGAMRAGRMFAAPGAKRVGWTRTGRSSRERRAGIEAVPLVVALVGLQITMLVMPVGLRTEELSAWTARNVAYALFVLIASGYLTYGFIACVRSIRRFLDLATGYLQTSLAVLLGGLVFLTLGVALQIVFIVGAATRWYVAGWLLSVSQVCSVVGVVAFLIGISYPMLHARWRTITSKRRHLRDAQALLPLWELVTDAVPEVVLPLGASPPPSMVFHRRVVEIRDALTQLSPYLTEDFEIVDDAARADMLWAAVEEYRIVGRARGPVRDVVPGGADLEADAAPLKRLSSAVAAQPVA